MAAEFSNIFWGLTQMGGVEQELTIEQQEPYFLISEDGTRCGGTMGCNRIMGSVTRDGDTVAFGPSASTMMACPPELTQTEAAFADMLEGASRLDLTDQSLRLLDDSGRELARFRSLTRAVDRHLSCGLVLCSVTGSQSVYARIGPVGQVQQHSPSAGITLKIIAMSKSIGWFYGGHDVYP